MWELGALRSRWRKQASKLLLIGPGDVCLFWWGYLVAAMAGMESSSLPLARQSACTGKSCNDRDGWTLRELLSNELVFWEEEYDYKIFPIT